MKFTTSITTIFLLMSTTALASPHGPSGDVSQRDTGRPCGFRIAPCPSGWHCSANDPSCPPIRGANCAGVCKPGLTKPSKPPTYPTKPAPPRPTQTDLSSKYKSCGGFRVAGPSTCSADEVCIDDPVAIENGSCGMACDRPGICVKPVFCGGFAGFACKDKNQRCVDDPRDDCDPRNGGADCGGICV